MYKNNTFTSSYLINRTEFIIMKRNIINVKLTLLILGFFVFIIATSFRLNDNRIITFVQNTEEPRVYYTIYKLESTIENRPKSEDSYKTFMIPGGVSMDVKDKIRHAKMKSLKNENTNVHTTTYKLKNGDRVLIYKIQFFDYMKRKYTKIYSDRISVAKEKYLMEGSWFVADRISKSFIESYYTGSYEILYDGVPFYIEEKESSVVGDMMTWMYQFVNDLDEEDIEQLKKEEAKIKKATAIGVRG